MPRSSLLGSLNPSMGSCCSSLLKTRACWWPEYSSHGSWASRSCLIVFGDPRRFGPERMAVRFTPTRMSRKVNGRGVGIMIVADAPRVKADVLARYTLAYAQFIEELSKIELDTGLPYP